MNNTLALIGIASAIAVGAMSPGPSFVMVARSAIASSRSDGVHAALGMGLGGMVFAAAALLGLHTLLATVPWLYFLMKILGGLYLIWLGFRIWRGAKQPLIVSDPGRSPPKAAAIRSLLLGFGTQISNPKTAIVYASVFAAILPTDVPLSLTLSLPFVIFIIEAGWYALVALVLSSDSPRAAYLHYKSWLDRTAGGIMSLLGVKLLASARQVSY